MYNQKLMAVLVSLLFSFKYKNKKVYFKMRSPSDFRIVWYRHTCQGYLYVLDFIFNVIPGWFI